MSNQESEQFRVRANTFEVKDPSGAYGFVLKIKPDELADLVKELSDEAYSDNGATIFLNIYENESKFDEGPEFYLSSTLSPIPTEEQKSSRGGRSNGRGSNSRSKVGNKIDKAYEGKVKSRGRKERR